MSDLSRFYYKDVPILLITLFDPENGKNIIMQKHPLVNYSFMKSQIPIHVRFLLNTRTKRGYTLYSKLTDYNFTNEIKVISTIINKLALIVFYSAEYDFYYIAQYVINFIGTIQCVCSTPAPNDKMIKKNLIDVNTMMFDTMGMFNCFTRIISNDFNAYLGMDAVYNQMCFGNIRNKDIVKEYRRVLGSERFDIEKEKDKKEGIIERGEMTKILFKDRRIAEMYRKFTAMRFKKYIGNGNYKHEENNFKHQKFYSTGYIGRNDYFNNNNNKANRMYRDEDNIMEKYHSHYVNKNWKGNNIGINDSAIGNNLGNFELIKKKNKANNNNRAVVNNKDNFDIIFDNETICKLNQNVMLIDKKNQFNSTDNKELSQSNIVKNVKQKSNLNLLELNNIDFTSFNPLPSTFYSTQLNHPINTLSNSNQNSLNKPNTFNSFNTVNPRNFSTMYNPYSNIGVSLAIGNSNNFNLNSTITPINSYQSNHPTSSSSMTYDNTKFSQDDMSFLSLTSSTQNQIKEDFLVINKKSPEIVAELKEKVYISFRKNRTITLIDSKGYIGINIPPWFKIYRKTFTLLLQQCWSNSQVFLNKSIESYLIACSNNQYSFIITSNYKQQMKLITYFLNPQFVRTLRVFIPKFTWISNNTLNIKLNFNPNVIKANNVYKTVIILFPRIRSSCFITSSNNAVVSQGKQGEFNLLYNHSMENMNIEFSGGCIYNQISKVSIRLEMKDNIISGNDISVTFSNNPKQQEYLNINRLSLLSCEFEI